MKKKDVHTTAFECDSCKVFAAEMKDRIFNEKIVDEDLLAGIADDYTPIKDDELRYIWCNDKHVRSMEEEGHIQYLIHHRGYTPTVQSLMEMCVYEALRREAYEFAGVEL